MWHCGFRHGEPIFVKTCSFFLVGLALHLDQGCCCSASCAGPRRVTKAWVNRLGIERQRWISFLWKRCWFKQITRQITEGITSSRLFKHGSLHKAVLTKEGWNEWLWLGYMDEKASWELQTGDRRRGSAVFSIQWSHFPEVHLLLWALFWKMCLTCMPPNKTRCCPPCGHHPGVNMQRCWATIVSSSKNCPGPSSYYSSV